MWSVVVLPLVFTRIGRSTKSLPSHLGNGARSWSRSLSGFTITWTESGSSAGASKPSSPRAKPSRGSSSASGAVNRKGRPSGPGRVPWTGSNSSVPAKASAVTISGLVKNERVAALPSFRPGKFRLNDDTIVFVSSARTSRRFH